MWIGFFLIFPIMFFGNQLRGNPWYNVFGVLALIGAAIAFYSFVKIVRKKKKK